MNRRSPAVSAGLDLPPLVVDRHPDDLAGLRGRLLLRWAQAQVVEDLLDGELVGDVGHDLERTSAAFAHERVRLIDLRDEPRPAWRAAALPGTLLLGPLTLHVL